MQQQADQSLNLVPLAQRFSINLSKPHFPLNTMRIFYLMLVRDLTGDNEAAQQSINDAVPKISSLLDMYDKFYRQDVSVQAVAERDING